MFSATRSNLLYALLLASLSLSGQAPKQDQAIYKEVLPSPREVQELEALEQAKALQSGEAPTPVDKTAKRELSLDFSKLDRPHAPGEFKSAWHFPPRRQWWTNTCWCYSTTSFLESEIKRVHGRELKLSEMFTVYWDYVEKVQEFIRTKGVSVVDEGAESGDVLRCWKHHGIVPEADFPELRTGEKLLNHGPLIDELHAYLDYVKKAKLWNEAQVVASVRLILDKHLGAPPAKVQWEGHELTPLQFQTQVVGLDLDAYVEFMSFQYAPFWTQAEYKVPDNWAHTKDYWNLPLADWYGALKGAVAAGYSVAIGGDVSEPGYEGRENIAIVPSFDIPAAFIDQSAREFRFSNHTSEDDHGLHVLGVQRRGEHDWFLIKDSARSSHKGATPGYYFYRDDYMRLKMLTFMVHKDAVKEVVAKFKP